MEYYFYVERFPLPKARIVMQSLTRSNEIMEELRGKGVVCGEGAHISSKPIIRSEKEIDVAMLYMDMIFGPRNK